jgi:peptide deformylase
MILPIYAFGHAVLREKCTEIAISDYENLSELLANMWETMYHTNGVGLAAPQIGKAIRIFIVDTEQITDDEKRKGNGTKKVFINATMLEETGEPEGYEEGCLSIPGIRGEVIRKPIIRIAFQDETGALHEEVFDGLSARVIQHEYDHIEGQLFTDKISPFKKQMVRRKLEGIKIGRVDADYKMKFAPVSKR